MNRIPSLSIPASAPGDLPSPSASVARSGNAAGQPTSGARASNAGRPFITGVSEVAVNAHLHGMPYEHLSALADYVRQIEHDVVVVVRPTHPDCASLARLGYPAKPAAIKSEAARHFGPLSGFIPEDPAFSTLDANDSKTMAAARAQVRQSVDGGKAVPTDLVVSRTRIDELARGGAHNVSAGIVPGTLRLECIKDGKPYVFIATPLNGPHQEYRITHEGKTVRVLGKRCDDRVLPYIGHYDLVMFGPQAPERNASENRLSGSRHVAADAGVGQAASRLSPQPISTSTLLRERSRRSPAAQAVSVVDEAQLQEMNEALGRARDNPILQRGGQAGRFEPAPGALVPCLVFAPKSVKSIDGVAYADDVDMLSRLVQAAKDEGYMLPVNTHWPGGVKDPSRRHVRDNSTAAKIAAFQARRQAAERPVPDPLEVLLGYAGAQTDPIEPAAPTEAGQPHHSRDK